MADPAARVRPASPTDAAAVAAVYAPYVTRSAASFEVEPPDAAEVAERMATGLPWYVAENAGGVAGFAYASPHRARAAYRWSIDVSVYVAETATGGGVGRALYDRLLPVLRELGYVRAHAGITVPNAASVGLHERCGFVHVGTYADVGFKLGRWYDVGWWLLALQAPPAGPAEPRTWDRLR